MTLQLSEKDSQVGDEGSSNDGFETATPDKVGNGIDREED